MANVIPLKLTVVRYQCPFCPRRHAKKHGITGHIDRCWKNPAARSCKTCEHYQDDNGSWISSTTESCAQGIELHTIDPLAGHNRTLPIGCPQWTSRKDSA